MKKQAIASLGLASLMVVSTAVTPVMALADTVTSPKTTITTRAKQSTPRAQIKAGRADTMDYRNIGEGRAFANLIPDANLRAAIYKCGQTTTSNPRKSLAELDAANKNTKYYDALNSSTDENAVRGVLEQVKILELFNETEYSVQNLMGISALRNLVVLDIGNDQGATHQITTIASNTFAGMSNLESLNLIDLNLENLEIGAFAGLTGLQSISLGGAVQLNNYDALYVVGSAVQYKDNVNYGSTEPVKDWEKSINTFATSLNVKTLTIIANKAIYFAKYKHALVALQLSRNVPAMLSNPEITSLAAELEQAVPKFELNKDTTSALAANLYAAINGSINQAITSSTSQIGTAGRNDADVKKAINDLDIAMQTRDYTGIAGVLENMQAAVTTYKSNVKTAAQQVVTGIPTNVTTTAAISAAITALNEALTNPDANLADLPGLLANLYTALDTSINQAVTSATSQIGTTGKNDPAVKKAINDLNTAMQNKDYAQIDSLLAKLQTTVTNYKTTATNQATTAVKRELDKNGDGNTQVAKKRAQLQQALKATKLDYDQLAILTKELNEMISKTSIAKYAVNLNGKQTYHLHKYAQGQIKGKVVNGVTVKATVNGKAIGQTKTDKNGKFKLNFTKKLAKNQQVKFSVDRPDEAYVIHQAASIARKVAVSPAITAKNFTVKKKQLTGKLTAKQGATITVYNGKKVVKIFTLKKDVKNKKVKFKLKKKITKKTKLKLVVQNTHDNGLATKTVKKVKVK
ncbi:leucine-rich repeat domain-containing protein [Periweissella cryptocerci]|uniref:Leucine-rich repeat domain-containing protein n=1 Tax=Periweissella cryptocerci TaxID=2506420 RepID=A0A4P6YST9_9LACO|nr:leucine-rich repeat domain-containing protein [Periweissella cryptocerci]QBO35712.1 leucine-rich repeat domain-containing protein [Periweissella cryptocerci]